MKIKFNKRNAVLYVIQIFVVMILLLALGLAGTLAGFLLLFLICGIFTYFRPVIQVVPKDE